MSPKTLIIPDTLRSWPWPRHINPHYAVCKAESSAWCEAFKAFDARAQKAFNRCDFSMSSYLSVCNRRLTTSKDLLASLAYPLLNRGWVQFLCPSSHAYPETDGCRVGCDLMNLFFVIDEHSDVSTTKTVRQQADVVMDAIRNPHTPRPENEWVGGEVARQ